MINEIKIIIQNYLDNMKLCSIVYGTVTGEGIQVSDKLILPMELVYGNLKKTFTDGDNVRLLRNHGGKQFYILEVIENDT